MAEVCHALHDGFVRRHSATSDCIVLTKTGIDAENFLPLFFIYEPIGHRRDVVAVIQVFRGNPLQLTLTRIEVVRREMRLLGLQCGHDHQRLARFLHARRRGGLSKVRCLNALWLSGVSSFGAHHEQRVVGPRRAGFSPPGPPPMQLHRTNPVGPPRARMR